MHIDQRQPLNATSRFAEANSIPYRIVDGNNVIDVKNAFEELSKVARNGNGPGFLETVTYRWLGHVDWREDIDVGVSRSIEDIKNWKERDPVDRLSQSMINSKIWTKDDEAELNSKIDNEIKISWEKAINDPYPSKDEILNLVYSKD